MRKQRRTGESENMDLKIAAIVVARHATLLTRNVSHFLQTENLRVEELHRAVTMAKGASLSPDASEHLHLGSPRSG